MRRLVKKPREDARSEVERLRQILTAEFLLLQTLVDVPGVGNSRLESYTEDVDLTVFDNLDDDPEYEAGTDSQVRPGPIQSDMDGTPLERRIIFLPSSHCSIEHPDRKIELTLRIKQAT